MLPRTLQIKLFFENIKFSFSSIFMALVPPIVTGIIGNFISKYLGIDIGKGGGKVLVLTIITILMAFLIFRKKPNKPIGYRSPDELIGDARRIKLQGNLFGITLLVTNFCTDLFIEPMSAARLSSFLLALVPVIEGILGAQFIENTSLKYFQVIPIVINGLIKQQSRITEKMVEAQIQKIYPDTSVFSSSEIRNEMFNYVQHKMFRDIVNRDEIVLLDSYRHPHDWQLVKQTVNVE